MDIVNFPGIIAEHGLLSSAQVDLAKDLLLIGKKMGVQRDGTQYENMGITVQDLMALAAGSQTLAQTLALGNITGGLNVVFSGGSQAVFNSGAFSGGLTTLALTGNQTWSLPDASGTIALLSDIPAPDITLYNGNGTIGTNRNATLTDNLAFIGSAGGVNVQWGIGVDPIGFGWEGIHSYMYTTPAGNLEAWGGLHLLSGDPVWWHEVYNTANDTSGTYIGWSAVQNNSYASLYHLQAGTGLYTGFEANQFGEQLYSQRLALVTTALTAADRVLFVSNAGGYIKATTYADLAALLPTANIYTADGAITANIRNVQVRNTLNFNHGAAGVNGYFQMLTGGYFRAQTSIATNYLEYNNINGVLTLETDTHTVTGTRFINGGGVGNPTSLVELYAGGNGTAYLNTGVTTGIFYILNNGGLSATNYTSSNTWSFGNGLPDHSVGLTVYGKGVTTATASQVWKNSLGSEQARFVDNGVLCIGTTTPSSGLGAAQKLIIDSTVSSDYSPSVIVNQYYSQTANNTNTSTGAVFSIYKGTAFNTLEMRGISSISRNDGTGSLTYMYGIESFLYNIGAATINSAFAYSARCQIRDGVVTNWGGLDISYQENGSPAVVTNMIGVFVRTPVNVLGINVTNTYGMLIQGNGIGTNNYAYVSDGKATSGLGTVTPNQQAMLHIRANHDPVFKAHVYFEPITSAQASTITPSDGMGVYVSDTNGTFTSIGFWKYENSAWAAW